MRISSIARIIVHCRIRWVDPKSGHRISGRDGDVNNVVDKAGQSACNSQREEAACDSGRLASQPADAAGAEQIA
jgi:hypothetical protein